MIKNRVGELVGFFWWSFGPLQGRVVCAAWIKSLSKILLALCSYVI